MASLRIFSCMHILKRMGGEAMGKHKFRLDWKCFDLYLQCKSIFVVCIRLEKMECTIAPPPPSQLLLLHLVLVRNKSAPGEVLAPNVYNELMNHLYTLIPYIYLYIYFFYDTHILIYIYIYIILYHTQMQLFFNPLSGFHVNHFVYYTAI